MKKLITVSLVVFCSLIMIISDNKRVFADPVIMDIDPPSGATIREGAYVQEGITTNEALLVGTDGANATAYVKNHNSAKSGTDATDTTINIKNSVSGATNAHTVVYVPDFNYWIIGLNNGAIKIDIQNHMISGFNSQALWGSIDKCIISEFDNFGYCIDVDDVTGPIYKLNPTTLDLTGPPMSAGAQVLDFAIDDTSGFVFTSSGKSFDLRDYSLRFTLVFDVACDGTHQGIAVDTEKDMFWISCSSDASIRKYSQAGIVQVTLASISTPRHMEIDSFARRLYVVSDTTDQVQVWDIDSNVALYTKATCNYQIQPLDIRRQSDHTKLFITCDVLNANQSQLIDDSSAFYQGGGAIDDPAVECIDTTGDAVTDICFTDTNGDGIADAGPAGALGAYRGTANATNFGYQINCAFGIGSCIDKNPKTNGVGLMYLLFLVIVSYAMLVGIHITAQKHLGDKNVVVTDALNINPMLLLVMLMIDVSITFYLGWIPDLFFYTVIVLLAGLASFGFYKKVSGSV